MHHEADAFWARGSQMSGVGWFNGQVMDASSPRGDLLSAVIQEAGGQVKPRSPPPPQRKNDVLAVFHCMRRFTD